MRCSQQAVYGYEDAYMRVGADAERIEADVVDLWIDDDIYLRSAGTD